MGNYIIQKLHHSYHQIESFVTNPNSYSRSDHCNEVKHNHDSIESKDMEDTTKTLMKARL